MLEGKLLKEKLLEFTNKLVFLNGEFKQAGRGRRSVLSAQDIYEFLPKEVQEETNCFKIKPILEEIKKEKEEEEELKRLDERVFSSTEFCQSVLQQRDYEILIRSPRNTQERVDISWDQVKNTVLHAWHTQHPASGISADGKRIPLPVTSLEPALMALLYDKISASRAALRESLAHKEFSEEETENLFIDLMRHLTVADSLKGHPEIVEIGKTSAAALMHWMWCVKRNLYDMPTKYELMVVLFGQKQGGGKSRWLRDFFCKPFGEDWYVEKSLEIFEDGREHKILGSKYIINFDECATKTNGNRGYIRSNLIANLKTIISAKLVPAYRVLGTHTQESPTRTANFIGSTNFEITNHFADATGMRRFFQIEVEGTFWDDEFIRNLNYTELCSAPLGT